jgi:hypothetical protein
MKRFVTGDSMKRFILWLVIALNFAAFNGVSFASTKAQSISFLLSQVRTSTTSLAGGKVYAYSSGTTTVKSIWIDRDKQTLAANPYTLDANGTAQLYGDGIYRIVIKDAAGVTKYDRDGLPFQDLSANGMASVLDYGTGTLSEAITAIGSTPMTLAYGTDQTLAANTVIPATLELLPLNGAVINHGAYTISYAGSTSRWHDAQMFAGTVAVSVLQGSLNPRWFGVTGDGTTDDTAKIQIAINSLSAGQEIVFANTTYKINGVITVATSGVHIRFNGSTFNIGDTGTSGTISNGSSGKMGFLFQAQNIFVTGNVRCYGQGTLGTTSLAGMVFDNCDNAQVTATMYFEKMAAGRFVMWCDRGTFGDVAGKDINGLQTFESPPTNNAGSLEVVIGCVYSTFGNASGSGNFKPVRYISTALDAGSNYIDNSWCTFGSTTGSAAATPTFSSVLSIRSATDCSFGPVSGTGFSSGVIITQYGSDMASTSVGFHIDRNTIASVTGTYVNTAASLDAAVVQEAGDTGVKYPIGHNTINVVDVVVSGEAGIEASIGSLTIGSASIKTGSSVSASNRGIALHGITTTLPASYTGTLIIGSLTVDGPYNEAIGIGKQCNLTIDSVDLKNGTLAASPPTGMIQYNAAFGVGAAGVGKVSVNKIRYAFAGGAYTNPLFLYVDASAGFEAAKIFDIDGTGASGQASFASDFPYNVERGRVLYTQAPTTGTYTVGRVVWNTAPAIGVTPGWFCITAGTPGTWRAMPVL